MTLHNIKEEEIVKQIVSCLDANQALTVKIHEVIERFSEKRVTLEEKMIRSYFHEMAAVLFVINATVHRQMSQIYTSAGKQNARKEPSAPRQDAGRIKEIEEGLTELATALEDLRGLQEKISVQLADLLKVLAYNLNFMEQYFEYGFYTRINNDDNCLEALKLLERRLTGES
ncbi:MAG: hypothetical protein SFV17_27390 [Candidatus Obscuribacter sp.]|nr:hypothetical protein [Candidatus Melainabacteria bacterium]MDX1990449.1 hypothetical protein [Candidatus Obscuribacter sp.]